MDNTNVQEAEVVEDQLLTPIPRKPGESITMDFPDAIREIINGKRVRRLSWSGEDYGLLRSGWLTIFTKNEKDKEPTFHDWLVNDGDLEGQDWIVIKDINQEARN